MTFIIGLLYLLGALVIVVTVLPIWRTSRWWVRLCDFPRFQVALVAFADLAALLVVERPLSVASLIFMAAVGAAALWQLTWVWPYLPGTPKETRSAKPPRNAPERVALMTTNVMQDSKDAQSLLAIIAAADPDLVLAVETDEWWCSKLNEGLRSGYPHSLTYPLSNGYGLALFARLELLEPAIRFLVDEAIPSIKTGVRLRSSAVIDFYGVHPRPPSFQQDSSERDTELLRVGLEISRTRRPSLVLGDLNDVAWSPTTAEFKRVGGLLDPRRGRGFFNTYPARLPGLRYPLDYIFHTSHFALFDMRLLPRFASDHLPLIVELCLQDPAPRDQA